MGLSRDQKVGGVVNEVAWFTLRERLRIARYLLNPWYRATVPVRMGGSELRKVNLWTGR